MKTIGQGNFNGKRVLLRCDFNVPIDDNGHITDDTRILESIPTIKKLLEMGASVVAMSHLGRPSGQGYEEKFSLAPVAEYLRKIFGAQLVFSTDIFTEKTVEMAEKLQPGQVLLLENLRFVKGETKGNEDFAKYLSRLGEFYVNDAFGTAHRAHSSTSVVAKFFPDRKYYGLLMAHEVENLEKLLNSSEKPYTAIVGGAKVSSKIDIIKNLIPIVDNIIVGGGMAYTFIKAKGGKIGKSLCEDDKMEVALEIMQMCQEKGVKLLLPSDTLCADAFSNEAHTLVVDTMNIPDGYMGMDMGPKAVAEAIALIKKSKSILWNGPLGVFEMPNFSKGTLEVGKAIAEVTKAGAYSAVGGGDSVAAAHQLNIAQDLSYVSTGGGAMLEYLEGKKLPGVEAIR